MLAAGTVQTIAVSKGDMVRSRARSSAPAELHVHAYDIVRELEPRVTARLSFTADIEGAFEIEIERSGVGVGGLRVRP